MRWSRAPCLGCALRINTILLNNLLSERLYDCVDQSKLTVSDVA